MVVTDKQIKQILRHLLTICEQANDGIAIVDLMGTISYVNPLWAEMHGCNTTDELIGKNISIFHTKEQMEADVAPLIEEAKCRDQLTGPIEHIRRDGGIFVTKTKIVPVRDEQVNMVALVVLAAGTTQNNPGHCYLADQSIEPIIIAKDEFQPQIIEDAVQSDSQVLDTTADIETDYKDQIANISVESEQAVTEQGVIPDEIVKQVTADTTEAKQAVNEIESQSKEEEEIFDDITTESEAECVGENIAHGAESDESELFAENIEHPQLEPELCENLMDKAEMKASVRETVEDEAEKSVDTKDSIKASRGNEESTEAKARVCAVPQNHQVENGQSETVVKDRLNETSLRDIFYVFFRHKWKMVSFFLAVIIIVAAVTSVCARVYRSEAKLLMRLGRESVTLDPTAATGQIVPLLQSRDNEINSELEILKSRELIEKVVDSIGPQELLNRSSGKRPVEDNILFTTSSRLKNLVKQFGVTEPLSDRDKAILDVAKNLRFENLKDSSIISIACEAENPKLAQEVVGKLIDFHLEKHISVHRNLGSRQFFDQQASQLRDKLMQSENELRNLKNETGVASVAEQQHIVLSRIGTLKQEIDQTDAALASSVAMLETLQRNFAEVPKTIVTEETTGYPNLSVDEMRKQLFERQLEELKLRTSFTDDSVTVKAIRKEIAEAQSLLNKEDPNRTQVTRGISKAYEQLQSALLAEQATMSSLRAKIDAQRKQLAEALTELKTLNDAEAKIAIMTREENIQETNYRKYSDNLEQARINSAMENERISNISVVQAATLPIKAIRPNKLLNLALGLFLGILGAIVLAIFAEYLDHSIKTPEEVEEKLQLPTLASIPRIRIGRVSPKVKMKKQTKTGNEATEEILAKLETPSRIREHYETFREQLLLNFNGSAELPYVLAVTGCRRNEGVSSVAANIAATMSRHHKNEHVLLVDANLKRPAIHEVFKTKLSPGLTDVLLNGHNSADTIQSLPTKNIHILAAGTLNGNLNDTFDSHKFTEMLNSMKKRYRFVVIDIPPLNEASSAARLAGLCDGTVLVVAAERLRREVMQKAKAQLMESNANILGVVLNKRRFHVPGWLYHRL